MSDLIKQLRDHASDIRSRFPIAGPPAAETLRKAATEIEYLRIQLTEARANLERSEDIRKASLSARDKLRADNAALVEALNEITCSAEMIPCAETAIKTVLRVGKRTLSQPHPGEPMIAELEALRAVFRAAILDQATRTHGMDCSDACVALTTTITSALLNPAVDK